MKAKNVHPDSYPWITLLLFLVVFYPVARANVSVIQFSGGMFSYVEIRTSISVFYCCSVTEMESTEWNSC